MARITKARGRKDVAQGRPAAGVANFKDDGGITYRISIGDHKVILSPAERDDLIRGWTASEKDFGIGATRA